MLGTPQVAVRVLGLGALLLVSAAVAIVLLRGSDDPYEVSAVFANASQLVGGEQVVVGGVAAGTVEGIELADDNRALVTFTVDDELAPLREGTVATVRSTSLVGLANRRVELTLPGDEAGEPIPDGATLEESATVSEVDLDQLFNTLDPARVDELKRTLRALERAGRGLGPQGNRGLRYLNPLLFTSGRLLSELNSSSEAVRRLLVGSSRLSGALAERAPEISSVVGNLNVATNAVGRQRAALTEAIEGLPDFLRRSNSTFVNLRAAADDLEPLIEAIDPVAERLGPFFSELRGTARGAVPTVRDLSAIVRRKGSDNDLTELTKLLVPLAGAALGEGRPVCGENPSADYAEAADGDFDQGALGEATCALRNSMPILTHFRPYTPELVGWFDDFSTSGTLDASGGIGRIAGNFNAFSLSPSNGRPELLSPVDYAELFEGGAEDTGLDVGNTRRCPGSNERDPGDGSIPFTDGGRLDCDPDQLPVGP